MFLSMILYSLKVKEGKKRKLDLTSAAGSQHR